MNQARLSLLSLLAGVALSACSTSAPTGTDNGTAFSLPSVRQSVTYSHTENAARSLRSATPNVIKQLQINNCCTIAVDSVLHRIYVGGAGSGTAVVDGKSLSILTTIGYFGGATDVDSKTHNVWLPGLYDGNVDVFSGVTESSITTVSLGDCPVASWVDGKHRYAWVGAQCGDNNDPVWVVNADTYTVVAGPIGTTGVMGTVTGNPVSGKLYINKNAGGNFEINPVTFQASPTSFGNVGGVDSVTDLLYGQVGNSMNIINGRSEKIEKTVALAYAPGPAAVNQDLNHVYFYEGGQNFIEVREGNTGTLLGTINLSAGTAVWALGADYKRALIYAAGTSGGNDYLYQIKDTY